MLELPTRLCGATRPFQLHLNDIPTEGSRLVFFPSIPALSTYGRCSVTLLQRQPRYSIDFAILSIRFGASHVSEALLRSGSRLPPMFLVCDATHHVRLAVSKDPKIFISPRFMIISTSTALRLTGSAPKGVFPSLLNATSQPTFTRLSYTSTLDFSRCRHGSVTTHGQQRLVNLSQRRSCLVHPESGCGIVRKRRRLSQKPSCQAG